MLERSYLRKSRQVWKLMTAMALMAIGLYLTVVLSRDADSYQRGLLCVFGGLTLGLGAMIWLIVSVRCPRCHARLIWRAATTREARDWLGELLRSGTCPSCGFEPVRDHHHP